MLSNTTVLQQQQLGCHVSSFSVYSMECLSVGSFCSKAPSAKTATGKPMTIKEVEEWCRKTPTNVKGMISVEGYIAGEKRYDQPNLTVKYLLYTGINGRKGEFPAVMLFFKKEAWNIEVGVCIFVYSCVRIQCESVYV